MPDPRLILISPADSEAPARAIFQAERSPRDYDWEPVGYGDSEARAETDLLDKEYELYNVHARYP